jgi:hypothetical protein
MVWSEKNSIQAKKFPDQLPQFRLAEFDEYLTNLQAFHIGNRYGSLGVLILEKQTFAWCMMQVEFSEDSRRAEIAARM